MAENKQKPIKVIIFGATGSVGGSLVCAGLSLGHQVTAFVRDEEKLRQQFGGELPLALKVVSGDALDEKTVAQAMEGHSAAVNAAASRTDTGVFEVICRNIVAQAEKNLASPKRLWLFGGVPGLTVPNTKVIGADLPGMPQFFQVHKKNYEFLKNSSLDWSFMCPAQMFFSGQEKPSERLYASTEFMPYKAGYLTRLLPKFAHSIIFLRKVNKMSVSYEDVAYLVMNNLEANGPYHRKRVGARYEENKG